MAIVEVNEIYTAVGGAWKAMRGQAVAQSGALRTVGVGSGVAYGGNWCVLKTLAQPVTVYVSPMVTDSGNGQTWRLTVSAQPDIISTGTSIAISGYITMSDTSVYEVSGTATPENPSVDTGIAYADDIEVVGGQIGASFTAAGYYLENTILQV